MKVYAFADEVSGQTDGQKTRMDAYCCPSSEAAFDEACGALRKL